ncbi:helix-turn-helix domain-containing protein [Sphingomonas histidinilytica]|uniref:LexA family protein n=1 Tax=Rhizorhabdus histidinilytica TaxID=439228 RepID=UPI001ADA3521|nr:LexA family transcriptional regulator [Rhizorhabdus histidinilytica]MBO9377696.1 helix-turn-helix domain-containing protein [Rhizorhabdus histidinilytica]
MSANAPNVAGNNIRSIRIERGLTQQQLADAVGVHFTTIAKLERSMRRLSADWIVKIADALNVQPGEIISLRTVERAPARAVPVVGKIAAGNWREAVQDATDWVFTNDGGPNSFALYPDGDSMNKVVPPNGYVIVDPDAFELLDGRYYAIMNGENETTFKQYRADPPRLAPCSTNPEHKPVLLGREPFTVVGRIVAQGSRL